MPLATIISIDKTVTDFKSDFKLNSIGFIYINVMIYSVNFFYKNNQIKYKQNYLKWFMFGK